MDQRNLGIVIGGGGYLGRAVAERWKRSGHAVLTVDLADADLIADGSVVEQYELIEAATVSLGDFKAIWLVVSTGYSPFTETRYRTDREISETVSSNLTVPLRALNWALYGQVSISSVVLLSSVYGSRVPDFSIYENLDRRNSEIYGATKAGVESLTRYYATLAGPNGPRINAVAPGGILDEKMHQEAFRMAYGERVTQKRMVDKHEVLEVIDFLAGDRSSGVVGQTIAVDAGYGL